MKPEGSIIKHSRSVIYKCLLGAREKLRQYFNNFTYERSKMKHPPPIKISHFYSHLTWSLLPSPKRIPFPLPLTKCLSQPSFSSLV